MKKYLALLFFPLPLLAFTLKPGMETNIIVPPHSPASVKYAAEELKWHLERRVGGKFNISNDLSLEKGIFLGTKKVEGVKADGFIIEVKNDRVNICGNDTTEANGTPFSLYFYTGSKGTLFGVYRFLEEFCGISWIAPGEIGLVMPEPDTLKIADFELRDEPAFKQRHTVYMYLMRQDRYPDRNVYGANFSDELLKWGMRIGLSSGKWPVPGNHTVMRLKLYEAFGQKHPEWFALQKDGSRGGRHGALCWSNPGLADMWFRLADAYFSGKPPESVGLPVQKYWPYPFGILKDEFMIDPSDEYDKFKCQCEKCRNSDIADSIWKVIAETGRRIREKHPDKYISTLAYPPKSQVPGIDLPPNIRVRLTVPGPNSTVGDPNGDRVYMKLLRDWSEKLNAPVPLWFYLVAHYGGMPGPVETSPVNFRNFAQQVRPYSDNLFYEFDTMNQTCRNYDLYLQSKIMWNPDLDLEAVKAQYFRRGYGPAATDIQTFYDRLETLWNTILTRTWDGGKEELPTLMNGRWRENKTAPEVFRTIYTATEINALDNMLLTGLAKVLPNSLFARRINILRDWIVEVVRNQRELALGSEILRQNSVIRLTPLSGAPSEEDWKAAPWRELSPLANPPLKPVPLKTKGSFKILADDNNLYFRAELFEPEIANSKTVPGRSGEALRDIWRDNDLEFFFCHGTTMRQLLINDLGAFVVAADMKWVQPEGIKVEVSRTENTWKLQAVIPKHFSGFDPARPGDYRINVFRSRNIKGQPTEYSTWSPSVQRDSVRNPNTFGSLSFYRDTGDLNTYTGQVFPPTGRKMKVCLRNDFSLAPQQPWKSWVHPKPEKRPTPSWNPNTGHYRRGAAMIDYPPETNGSWGVTVPVLSGERLRVSAFMKHDSGRVIASCGFQDAANKWVGYDKYGGSTTAESKGEWRRMAFEIIVPQDSEIKYFAMSFSGSAPGQLLLDDVVIEKE